MKLIIVGFVIIIVMYLIFVNKVKIKFKTFTRKGFKPTREGFGVYCYCGKQGKGKTYSVIEYLLYESKGRKIYCNIPNIKNIEYTYIKDFKELLAIKDKGVIIVYDEIFTAIENKRGLSNEVLSFLSQMRKDKNIFLTTAQEWVEINITVRRYVRYQIDCNMFRLFNDGILIKTFRDGDNMKWDNDEQEHIAPILSTTISKVNILVANSYDTYQKIEVFK